MLDLQLQLLIYFDLALIFILLDNRKSAPSYCRRLANLFSFCWSIDIHCSRISWLLCYHVIVIEIEEVRFSRLVFPVHIWILWIILSQHENRVVLFQLQVFVWVRNDILDLLLVWLLISPAASGLIVLVPSGLFSVLVPAWCLPILIVLLFRILFVHSNQSFEISRRSVASRGAPLATTRNLLFLFALSSIFIFLFSIVIILAIIVVLTIFVASVSCWVQSSKGDLLGSVDT